MNKDIDDFVARIRHAKSGYFLQFKIKNFEHDWNEISIELNNSEIKTVINVLREYFTPRNVIARTRKFYKYNDKITFYWDSLRHLGEYLEIEGEDTMVDEVLNHYFLLNTSDVEAPYGKILESLNINMDEEIEEVTNSFIG
ncbi:hypothetical protein AGMMS49525_17680 [Bacteroidia bacterium]|nr:hypothetical protein AGMMS49525_17680 [Bacteroidia bacterium]